MSGAGPVPRSPAGCTGCCRVLLPGGARKFLSARQARTALASVRPRDLAGKTRRRLAAGLAGGPGAAGQKTRALDKEPAGLVTARGSTLMDRHGTGPPGAARLLADAAGIRRFAPPRPVRLLERHRTPGRLLRQPGPAPALPRREPAHQPRPAHHGRGPAAEPGQGPRRLRRAAGRRHAVHDGHARPETAAVQRCLRPHARRPETTRSEPGRATRRRRHLPSWNVPVLGCCPIAGDEPQGQGGAPAAKRGRTTLRCGERLPR